jgi:hypothetical protein
LWLRLRLRRIRAARFASIAILIWRHDYSSRLRNHRCRRIVVPVSTIALCRRSICASRFRVRRAHVYIAHLIALISGTVDFYRMIVITLPVVYAIHLATVPAVLIAIGWVVDKS